MKTPIAALTIFALAACAEAPMVAEKGATGPNRVECAKLTEPEVPGGHGAYGGFYDDEHPYYLPPERPHARPPEKSSRFVDPYFNPGENSVQFQAYRACLLRAPPPENG